VIVAAEIEIDQLYRDVGPSLWRAINAYCGGQRAIADDCVAEAFARLIQAGPAVRRPFPWLYRTAFRLAAAELRRAGRQVSDASESPREIAAGDDAGRYREVISALRELSPSQRAAIYLHYQADLPVRDVAGLMGTSAAAVKVHLHRGRRRLRELLGDEELRDD
jgi:RNA polymerase sigma-70 factor, ECF subfamily